MLNSNIERNDVIYQRREPIGSIIEVRSIFLAFMISVFYHLVILVFLKDTGDVQIPLFEFGLFVLSDIAIWTLGLIPLFALWRKLLAWYDPFFIFMMIIFGTFSTAFIAVCIDPASTAIWMSYGALSGFDPAKGSFYLMLFQAEIIMFVFMFILLLTNRKIVRYPLRRYSIRESRAALVTGIILTILGIFGFFSYWQDKSFLTTVLSASGTYIPETGTARFLLIQGLASTAISLGLIGWLRTTGKWHKNQEVKNDWLVLVVIFVTLLPNFVTGARLDILIAIVTPLVVLRLFNFSFRKRVLGIAVIILVVSWLSVTIIRGNGYTTLMSSSLNRLSISEAINNYSQRLGSTNEQLLYADRVGNIAYIVKNINGNGQYLYGQTLIAGLANYAADFSARLSGEQRLQGSFLLANQYITQWRFGNPYLVGWPVPPSVEGEFYMQGGYIAVIILSYLLGSFFFWLRLRIVVIKSLVLRWFLFLCLIEMAFYFTMGEVSTVYTYILYLMITVIVYFVILMLINVNQRTSIPVGLK